MKSMKLGEKVGGPTATMAEYRLSEQDTFKAVKLSWHSLPITHGKLWVPITIPQAFFYQSNCKEPGIVGIMEVRSGWAVFNRLYMCVFSDATILISLYSFTNTRRLFERPTRITPPSNEVASTMMQRARRTTPRGTWSTASWYGVLKELEEYLEFLYT